jgi:hypothetical protein
VNKKTKKTIERMRINKNKNINKLLIEGWNWIEKSIQQKAQKIIKRMRTKLEKIIYTKLGWNDEIENK